MESGGKENSGANCSPSGSMRSNRMLAYFRSRSKKSSKPDKNGKSLPSLADDESTAQTDPNQLLTMSELSESVIQSKTDVNDSICSQDTQMNEESTILTAVSSASETCVQQDLSNRTSEKETRLLNSLTDQSVFIPIAYLPYNKSFLDIKLANGLKEVTELIVRINDNETHLMQVLSKHIKNPQLHKDLLDAHKDFVILQVDIERKSYRLAHEMWQQQLELSKSHERSFQASLLNTMKLNRQLQDENELLMQKSSEILLRSSVSKSTSVSSSTAGDGYLGDFVRINSTLRSKINYLTKHLEVLENELLKAQRENRHLEEEISDNSSHMQNYKAMLQRVLIDRELEEVSLGNDVTVQQKMINDALEVSCLLLNEFNSAIEHVKITKNDDGGRSLVNVIQICRACLKDLTEYLKSSHRKLKLAMTDSERLKHENVGLKESIVKLEVDKNASESRLKDIEKYEAEVAKYEKRMKEVLVQFDQNALRINSIAKELNNEKVNSKNKENYIEELHRKLVVLDQEKNELVTELKQSKLRTSLEDNIYSAQREILVMQDKDHAEKLNPNETENELQEKLRILSNQLEQWTEKETNYQKEIQKQQSDLDTMNKSVLQSKEHLDLAQSTIQALQLERIKHLEQKHQLENKIEHYKNDEGNLKLIREAVMDLTIGNERLINELSDKNARITELSNQIKQYEHLQSESFNCRNMLEKELADVRIKHKSLENQLDEELKKTSCLKKQKRENEMVQQNKLKAMQEKQKSERGAVKELLKDFGEMANERQKFNEAQKAYLNEINVMQKHLKEQWKIITNNKALSEEKSKIICQLEEKLKSSEEQLQTLRKNEVDNVDNFGKLQSEFDTLKGEKLQLQDTISFLKTNLKKLQKDVDEERSKQLELAEFTEQLTIEKDENLAEISDNQQLITALQSENAKLKERVEEIEYKRKITTHDDEEKLGDLCELNDRYKEEVESLKRELQQLNSNNATLIKQLEHKVEQYETACMLYDEAMRDKDKCKFEIRQLLDAEERFQQLLEEMDSFRSNHSNCQEVIATLTQHNNELKEELTTIKEREKINYEMYQKQLGILNRDFLVEKEDLQEELQSIHEKLDEFTVRLQEKNLEHAKLEGNNKNLAGKLFKAIKMLIDEKCGRQASEAHSGELVQVVARLRSEKDAQEQQIEILDRERAELTARIEELARDKQKALETGEKLQEACQAAVAKCADLEQKHLLEEIRQKRAASKQPNNDERKKDVSVSSEEDKLQLSYDMIDDLKQQLNVVSANYSVLEFKQCEHVLRLHELNGKLEVEEKLNKELRGVHEKTLAKIQEMTENGRLTPESCNTLLTTICYKDIP